VSTCSNITQLDTPTQVVSCYEHFIVKKGSSWHVRPE
jgi:hypothetical protein